MAGLVPPGIDLAHIVGEIHLAGGEPTRWAGALDAICDAVGEGAGGLVWSPFVGRGGLRFGHNLTAEAQRALDEPVEQSWTMAGIETALVDVAGAGLTLGDYPEEITVVRLFEGRSGKSTRGTARDLLAALRPHLEQAARTHWRLARAEGCLLAARAALDAANVGILWLRPSGEVVEANPAAKRLLAEGDGLVLDGDHLRAELMTDNRRLGAFLAGLAVGLARRPRGALHTDREGPLVLRRRSGAPVWSLSGLPVVGAEPRIALFVTAADRLAQLTAARLARLHGLTPAEADIAEAIASGLTVDEIAAARGRSAATVRTQVKTLMAKMGVTRQADILRLASRVGLVREL